ncbi:MAG: tetratricopeptide repeat protein [Emcibacteraceae bacterium]|nr:tetratricopeptide repeat protein [Emcibacteraceae bacterium]
MKKAISYIISKLYVIYYVAHGYIRHYIRNADLKTVFLTLSIFSSGIFFTITHLASAALSGNDALSDGLNHLNNGNSAAAYVAFKSANEIFKEEKNTRGVFVTSKHLGDIDYDQQKYTKSLTHYDTALRFAQFLKYDQAQIAILRKHADVKLKLNRVNAARAHYLDAVKISQDMNSPENEGIMFTLIGNLERNIDNDRRALFAYRNALKAYEGNSGLKGEASLYWNYATLQTKTEDYDDAIVSFTSARDLYRRDNDTLNEATITKHMARLEVKRGLNDSATSLYNEAAILYASIGKTQELDALKIEVDKIHL